MFVTDGFQRSQQQQQQQQSNNIRNVKPTQITIACILYRPFKQAIDSNTHTHTNWHKNSNTNICRIPAT